MIIPRMGTTTGAIRRRASRALAGWEAARSWSPGSVIALPLALVGLALLFAPISGAKAEQSEGWTPALRVGFGYHVQGLDGQGIITDALPAIQDDPNFTSLGAPGDSIRTPAFRLGLRLYSPEDLLAGITPASLKHAPRLFVQGTMEKPLDDGFFGSRYNADFDAFQGGGSTVGLGDFCPEVPPTTTCSYEAGTNIDVLYNWRFVVGADFRLPIDQGQFHLVPSVGYVGQAFEAEGAFTLRLSQSLASDDTRIISAEGDTEILHGVTAGLAFEVDVYESERFAARMFIEGTASWLLNDRDSAFSGTSPIPTTNFSGADFVVRPSGFMTMGAGGMEIRWLGN